jgi:hypothetical protein
MYPIPGLPSRLAGFFERLSNDELHNIGHALIKQSQSQAQQQYQTNPPQIRPRHDLLNQSPKPILPLTHRPTTEQPMGKPRMNHQVANEQPNVRPMHLDRARPLMGIQQEFIPESVDSSTPRRPAGESFDYSDGKQRHATKRARNNDLSPRNYQSQQPHHPLQHQHQPVTASAPLSRSSFNINVLKRAVSSNLPCFFIDFDPTIELNRIPSCTQVAILLKKYLQQKKQLLVNELSMCVQAGARRLKFAVGDKADFLALYNWS